jgi:hypothetical protein
VINFIKDGPKRVRAKCDWSHCPWVCLVSDNSRTEGWQIVTFEEFHTCPPRRDNRLVTARRIAEKYEKFIMANPSWNIVSMMQTVQEEMFANISVSKLKRAKAMVMEKALDASKGYMITNSSCWGVIELANRPFQLNQPHHHQINLQIYLTMDREFHLEQRKGRRHHQSLLLSLLTRYAKFSVLTQLSCTFPIKYIF